MISSPQPVKSFVGMLSGDSSLFNDCVDLLTEAYGPVDLQGPIIPWDHTDYYTKEMGPGLKRQFIFFERLAGPEVLPDMKHSTNGLEKRFTSRADTVARRRINLDPGYLTEAKVVLATTKDYAHRVYLGKGIFAEVALTYHDGNYVPSATTYPDYRDEETRKLFAAARDLLRKRLR